MEQRSFAAATAVSTAASTATPRSSTRCSAPASSSRRSASTLQSAATGSGSCTQTNYTDTTAFRFGTAAGLDGLLRSSPTRRLPRTLAQPYHPGFDGPGVAARLARRSVSLRPNDVDTFNFSIQRQINRKMLVEVGYIGRLIHHEYIMLNPNQVPYKLTQGGQTFESAYLRDRSAFGCTTSASLCCQEHHAHSNTITPQPFFETALGGTGSATAPGYAQAAPRPAGRTKQPPTSAPRRSSASGRRWTTTSTAPDGSGLHLRPQPDGTPQPPTPPTAPPVRSSPVSASAPRRLQQLPRRLRLLQDERLPRPHAAGEPHLSARLSAWAPTTSPPAPSPRKTPTTSAAVRPPGLRPEVHLQHLHRLPDSLVQGSAWHHRPRSPAAGLSLLSLTAGTGQPLQLHHQQQRPELRR